jgi:23S rRNA pseudouridine1911/1915/1917 synthase
MVKFETGEQGEEILSLSVSPERDGACIKDFLHSEMRISATLLKKVKFGGVFVGNEAGTMRKRVYSGDSVKVVLPKEASEGIEAIHCPLDIIFEDEHLLVINKPSGMPVHPSRGNHLVTLANAVMAHVGEPFVFRSVNRLDRDTEGLVIIAKSQYSAGILAEDMKAGRFEKRYTALLSKAPSELSGIIDAPIEREREGDMKRCVRQGGKRAVTEYEVKEILPDGRAICKICLHTGRTHQIRVHLAYIGAPLYADFLYGDRIEGESFRLKADELIITHPVSRKKVAQSPARP